MNTVLIDHNIEGQATLLGGTLVADGWLEIAPLRLVTFADVGLSSDCDDREVWRFAQAHRMLLLTNNRSMKGPDSLEQTIREESTLTSLPVLTIGNANELDSRSYRKECAARLVEVILDMDSYLGTSRIFIP